MYSMLVFSFFVLSSSFACVLLEIYRNVSQQYRFAAHVSLYHARDVSAAQALYIVCTGCAEDECQDSDALMAATTMRTTHVYRNA